MFDLTEKTTLSKSIKIIDGHILRLVNNIDETKKIIEILNKINLMGTSVINTKIYSEEDNLIEHEKLKNIIHSEEYTESMAYDISEVGFNLITALREEGLYNWDIVPNNFSLINGNWVLHDFDSISFFPNHIKTLVRSLFKISFSSFELTSSIIPRKYIKQCFLNRVSAKDLINIVPLKKWYIYVFQLYYCLLLTRIGLNSLVIKQLKKIFGRYKNNFQKKYYNYSLNVKSEKLYCLINNILDISNTKDLFIIAGVGEEDNAINFALSNRYKDTNSFVYIDDYEKCDNVYNYLQRENIKNIKTAVLYPLVCDENIPKNYTYRALYDDYAKERFNCDTVIIFDFDKLLKTNGDISELLGNKGSTIIDFTNNNFIMHTKSKDIENITKYLKDYFEKVEVIYQDDDIIISCTNKTDKTPYSTHKMYRNHSRGANKKLQIKQLKEIIKKYKS